MFYIVRYRLNNNKKNPNNQTTPLTRHLVTVGRENPLLTGRNRKCNQAQLNNCSHFSPVLVGHSVQLNETFENIQLCREKKGSVSSYCLLCYYTDRFEIYHFWNLKLHHPFESRCDKQGETQRHCTFTQQQLVNHNLPHHMISKSLPYESHRMSHTPLYSINGTTFYKRSIILCSIRLETRQHQCVWWATLPYIPLYCNWKKNHWILARLNIFKG